MFALTAAPSASLGVQSRYVIHNLNRRIVINQSPILAPSPRVALSTSNAQNASVCRSMMPHDIASLSLLGLDTTGFDTAVINAMKIGIPLYMAGVGALFVFGTIYKVAFPDTFDNKMYGDAAKKDVAGIDLDNLSEEDKAAVAALEAEMRAQGKL